MSVSSPVVRGQRLHGGESAVVGKLMEYPSLSPGVEDLVLPLRARLVRHVGARSQHVAMHEKRGGAILDQGDIPPGYDFIPDLP